MRSEDARPRRRLRVVTLVDRIGSGGAERLAVELATGLDQARFETIVCISRRFARIDPSWRAAEARLRAAGVRILQLRRRRRLSIAAWAPLVALLRRERVDVLHAHMFGSNVWGTVLGRLSGVPVVIAHDHGWSFSGSRTRAFVDRNLIARGTDAFIAVSRENRRRMIEVEGIAPADILHVPNGSPDIGPATGPPLRAALGIGPTDPVIGTVCVLRPEKAIEVMLEATVVLRRRFPSLRLLIAGEGPTRSDVEARIADLELDRAVTLLGVRTDVADVIASFDVAVCSSDYEGSPLSLMEYMEGARPIVATRVGGVPDIVQDGVHGLLVAPRDASALAEAVAELLLDPARRARMGAEGQRRRRAEFSIAAMIGRFERLYEELRARKP